MMVSMKVNISEGYTYQKIDGMVEVTDKSFSESLMSLAGISQCNLITKEAAITMGFEELANWSTSDDILVLIESRTDTILESMDIFANAAPPVAADETPSAIEDTMSVPALTTFLVILTTFFTTESVCSSAAEPNPNVARRPFIAVEILVIDFDES